MIQNVRKQINKCYHIAVMGIVTHIFKKRMLHRYDKDGYTPYLSSEDFAGLNKETHTFINSLGVEISYFYYYCYCSLYLDVPNCSYGISK